MRKHVSLTRRFIRDHGPHAFSYLFEVIKEILGRRLGL
jgi:hypothetical protein